MITTKFMREKFHEKITPIISQSPADQALKSFVIYELCYGGQIADIQEWEDKVSVSVFTRVLDCRDTTTFTGSRDEMAEILAVTYATVLLQRERGHVIEAVVDRVMAVTDGKPLFVATMGPLIMGASQTRVALLAAFGVLDESVPEALLKMSMEDLLALLLMHKRDQQPVTELLAILGPASHPANAFGI